MSGGDSLHRLLWPTWFWLPENITWNHLREYTQEYELADMAKHCFYVACCLTVLRLLLTSVFLVPLGVYFGLKIPKRNSIPHVPKLEAIFLQDKRPNKEAMEVLSAELDMPVKALDFWFHKRRNLEKKPGIIKFSESGWKLCFYCTMFCYGVVALYDKEYLYDVKLSLVGYPRFRIQPEIYWYYAIELAYYLSEMFWVFHSVKRSDFFVLLIHHMATVGLLAFSYVINHHRIGALVLLLHDIADCWMESAKMCKYVKKHQLSERLFTIFVLVWIATRLVYFPFWIIYTILTAYPFSSYPAHMIIVGWLLLLQAMHIYWFFLIMKIAIQVKTQGDRAKDCRSDSDTSDDVNYKNDVYLQNGGDGHHKSAQLPHCNGHLTNSTQVSHRTKRLPSVH